MAPHPQCFIPMGPRHLTQFMDDGLRIGGAHAQVVGDFKVMAGDRLEVVCVSPFVVSKCVEGGGLAINPVRTSAVLPGTNQLRRSSSQRALGKLSRNCSTVSRSYGKAT